MYDTTASTTARSCGAPLSRSRAAWSTLGAPPSGEGSAGGGSRLGGSSSALAPPACASAEAAAAAAACCRCSWSWRAAAEEEEDGFRLDVGEGPMSVTPGRTPSEAENSQCE